MIVRPPWSKALTLRHHRRRLADRLWLGRQADADRRYVNAQLALRRRWGRDD